MKEEKKDDAETSEKAKEEEIEYQAKKEVKEETRKAEEAEVEA